MTFDPFVTICGKKHFKFLLLRFLFILSKHENINLVCRRVIAWGQVQAKWKLLLRHLVTGFAHETGTAVEKRLRTCHLPQFAHEKYCNSHESYSSKYISHETRLNHFANWPINCVCRINRMQTMSHNTQSLMITKYWKNEKLIVIVFYV